MTGMSRSAARRSRREVLGFGAALATSLLPARSIALDDVDHGPVSVLDYGADPTGRNDSTAALNAALADTMTNGKPAHAGRMLRIPTGLYTVTGTLKIGSGHRVAFDPGVRIDATRLPSDYASLFLAAGQTTIELSGNGAELIGASARAHTGVEGGQTGILLYSCTNVIVRDFRIRDFATDGLYVGGESSGNAPSRNVHIENCEVRGCRRNGLSIVDCDGCLVVGGLYAGSVGAPSGPWAGIDVEPNENQQTVGVKIQNVKTQDNAGAGLLFVPGAAASRPDCRFDVEVTGGQSHGDGSVDGCPALRFACGGPMKHAMSGRVAVRGFQVFSPKSSGVAFTNWDADKAPLALLEEVAVFDPDGTTNARDDMGRTAFVIYCDRRQDVQALGNIRLIRCHAEDRRGTVRMVRGGILAADAGKSVRNVEIRDFTTLHASAKLNHDFSTLASEMPGGLADVSVEYTKQEPMDTEVGTALHELGGRQVRAIRSGIVLRLPLAANCRGLAMIVSAAPGIQGTVVEAERRDRIEAAWIAAGPALRLMPGQVVTLRSDGNATWTAQ